MFLPKASLLGLISVFLAGLALGSEVIPNWSAPATWTAQRSGGVHTMTDVTDPLPFIGVTPCRIWDTRGNGFAGQYGPPSIAANAQRTFTITGQCGIPAFAEAVSFNIGALNVGGAGDLRVFPAGGAVPLVSTLNYNANTPNIANAAVVPLGIGGDITLQADAVTIDSIGDVNGYYSSSPDSNTTFRIQSSAHIAIEGRTFSAATDSVGVAGNAVAGPGAGATFGVVGVELSPAYKSAGVRGVDFSGYPTSGNYLPAGVRGESVSAYGVLGLSQSYGVAGALHDSTGTQIAYGILGATGGVKYGVYSGGDFGGTGAKYFVEPHPTDASKVIRYVSLEGPESGTYFRGRGRFQNGLATIEVPADFRMVTDSEGLSIQVTPIGDFASVAVVRMELDEIVVKATRNVEFFYTVNGVRRTHRDLKPIGPGTEFMPSSADARMPAYLTEGQKAMLISNGTYNPDGTVNMETAERLGWTKMWADREAQAKATAEANAAKHAAMMGERK